MSEYLYNYFSSPLGEIELASHNDALVACSFLEINNNVKQKKLCLDVSLFTETKKQLQAYFKSELQNFQLPLEYTGTNFQKKVWAELSNINFGKTLSYLQLAKNLGDPKCIRAAASANGKNPFAIIVPCHRVIGTDGSLTGYAGNLWRKKWLLEHEQNTIQTHLKL